jgi:hypothetical protein
MSSGARLATQLLEMGMAIISPRVKTTMARMSAE